MPLYLDSTLALNPDTGELVWYFQHQANGQWDLDWAFERQVMDLSVNGETKSVVVTVGKQAIFDILETDTGKYVTSIDLGLQNVVTGIDPTTGAKTVDPRLVPGDGRDEDDLPARERRARMAAHCLRRTREGGLPADGGSLLWISCRCRKASGGA